MISGPVLLLALGLVIMVLFAIAYFKKPKTGAATKTSYKVKGNKAKVTKANQSLFKSKPGAFNTTSNSQSSRQISRLKKRIESHFPQFVAIARDNHLVLERADQKVAMLTIDAQATLGRRRLGEVAVINFHNLPSVEELRIELSGV